MAADGSLANESNLYFCGNSSLLSNFCPSWNAFAANPWGAETRSNHCGDPNSWGHYATCDTADVSKNVNEDYSADFGPGSSYTINTNDPFTVTHTFIEGSNNNLISMTTMFSQNDEAITVTNTDDTFDNFSLALSYGLGGWVLDLYQVDSDSTYLTDSKCSGTTCTSPVVIYSDFQFLTGGVQKYALTGALLAATVSAQLLF